MHAYVKWVIKELDLIRWNRIRLVSIAIAKEFVRYATRSCDVIEVVINSLVELIRPFQITPIVLIILVTLWTLNIRAILVDEVASWMLDDRSTTSVYLATSEYEVRVLWLSNFKFWIRLILPSRIELSVSVACVSVSRLHECEWRLCFFFFGVSIEVCKERLSRREPVQGNSFSWVHYRFWIDCLFQINRWPQSSGLFD